jgi:hypothetical protein
MSIIGNDDRQASGYANVVYGKTGINDFTGALISNDLVATMDVSNDTNAIININGINISATKVYADVYNKLALYQLQTTTSVKPLTPGVNSQQYLNLGTTLVSFDEHNKQSSQKTSYNNSAKLEKQFIEGSYYYTYTKLTYTNDIKELTPSGSNGSPILNQKGELVGFHHYSTADNRYPETQYNFGIAIDDNFKSVIIEYDLKVNSSTANNTEYTNSFGNRSTIHRYIDTERSTHVYTTSVGAINDFGNDSPRFRLEGQITDGNGDSNDQTVYEFYGKDASNFFYTTSEYERDIIKDNPGYTYNGAVFGIEDDSMYRLYDFNGSRHFITDSYVEAQALVAQSGYVIEGFL